MGDDKNDKKKKFNVVDRRFWAQGEDADQTEETSPRPVDKPSYVAKLEREIEEKERTLRDYIAQHKQKVDDFESAKERIRREMAKEVERNQRAVFADLIEVLDYLEQALQSAGESEAKSALAEGVVMVCDLFKSKLSNYGVTRIEALGRPFDPSRHEAISVAPLSAGQIAGQIVAVVRDGYALGDQVLRPAGVVVAQDINRQQRP